MCKLLVICRHGSSLTKVGEGEAVEFCAFQLDHSITMEKFRASCGASSFSWLEGDQLRDHWWRGSGRLRGCLRNGGMPNLKSCLDNVCERLKLAR